MIEANQFSPGSSNNTADFRAVFVARVHEIVQSGYQRLNGSAYAKEQEPAITGELVKAMTAYLRDAVAPDWADHFSVHDDPPVNDGQRKGKERRRIDIRVDSSTPRPGTTFSFEAKRLAPTYNATRYLGDDGLGCFVSGAYASMDDEAGMLGYIQSDDPVHWAKQIESALTRDQTKYAVSGTDYWKPNSFTRGPSHCFLSTHSRASIGRPIRVYHTLLQFSTTASSSATR